MTLQADEVTRLRPARCVALLYSALRQGQSIRGRAQLTDNAKTVGV